MTGSSGSADFLRRSSSINLHGFVVSTLRSWDAKVVGVRECFALLILVVVLWCADSLVNFFSENFWYSSQNQHSVTQEIGHKIKISI